MAAVKKLVQFSVPELRDLLSHVRDNRNSGAYWGSNQEQFYARQERIIKKLEEVLGETEVA